MNFVREYKRNVQANFQLVKFAMKRSGWYNKTDDERILYGGDIKKEFGWKWDANDGRSQKMNRIWNALRYGDSTTRRCIGSVIACSVIAVILIVIAGLKGMFMLFVVGLLFGVAAIIISQSFTLVDEDFVAEVDAHGKKDTVKAMSAQKNIREKKEKEEPEEGLPGRDRLDRDRPDRDRAEEEDEQRFAYYNEQVMKKLRRKYHIRKDHRPILIDYSKSYHIKECPAFIWRANSKVFLLLLEQEPRRISISRDLIRHMDYVPEVPGDKEKEYRAFRKENLVTKVFAEFLPDYFPSRDKKNHVRHKNLYMIYPDIRISNRSAAQVLDLLCLNFMPQDKITKNEKLNGYFKRVYAAHIMYRDRVYSITEYKDSVDKILSEFSYADIPRREFLVTLENLVRGQMISQEYADYYADRREKIASGKKL